jgi:hypothetical protein
MPCSPFLVSISAKFGICTVVGLNGTLVEAKKTHIHVIQLRILALTNVTIRPTKVQITNLSLKGTVAGWFFGLNHLL